MTGMRCEMYRILIADDEGIMLEALKSIIISNFGNQCELAFAKTGRAVVELAESFRPDIAFMDIQMPGINGIQAIKEIRKFHISTKFIIITAYDKFDYAKEAINLGVIEYLTKPVKKSVVVEALEHVMKQISEERQKRSDNLRIQEQLETVIPIVENGLVNNMILQEQGASDISYYKILLDIRQEYAYVVLIQFGISGENDVLTTPVGMSAHMQSHYAECRSICKEFFPCIAGPIMTNRIVLVVPCDESTQEYRKRIEMIEQARHLTRKLSRRFEAKFRAGIGKTYRMEELKLSYLEAYRALSQSNSSVAHVDDLTLQGEYTDDYTKDMERRLFQQVTRGDRNGMRQTANELFDWMIRNYYDYREGIQLKVLEFVICAEREASLNGGIEPYGFHSRKDYMKMVLECAGYTALRAWFLQKLEDVCKKVATKQEKQSESIVSKAKQYINQNFSKELTLDEVSRNVNISPYYFSKLFKEETGENFIEYLTKIRIRHAKELLKNPLLSIKEICVMSGYSDPNYFSRIFKKQERVTPSEYRESL